MTIIGNSNAGITLSPSNPNVTLTGSITGFEPAGELKVYRSGEGYVYFGLQALVQGVGQTSYRILNTGNVADNFGGALFIGILLGASGALTNDGTILSGGGGVYMLGRQPGAYVLNDGLIAGSKGVGVYLLGQANIRNAGTIAGGNGYANPQIAGIYLGGGGNVYNSGTVTGAHAIAAQGSTALINNGKLSGLSQDAVYLSTGVVNNGAAGLITTSGGLGNFVTPAAGVHLAYGGTVLNQGSIAGQAGILLSTGGSISNFGSIAGGAGIEAYDQVGIYNARGIGNNFSSFGVLGVQGSDVVIFNRHAAVIKGRYGASLTAGAIQNHGTIEGTEYNAVKFSGVGTLNNLGLLETRDVGPYNGAPAVNLMAGGTVHNNGSIISSGGGLVSNTGTIESYNTFFLNPPGPGIAVTNGGTIIDSGAITGFPTAISFAPGFTNILSLTPSAAITGSILLNGKLDLAAGAGTINLAQIAGLDAIDFGTGAHWQLIGALNPTVAIYNSGTLTNPAGPGLTLAAPVYNYGLISGTSAGIVTAGGYAYNSGQVIASGPTGTGIALTKPGYVINQGTIRAATGIALSSFASQAYNYGLISATSTGIIDNGYVYNAGIIIAGGTGIYGAGTAINAGTIIAGTFGIEVGAVYNYGFISADTGVTLRASSEFYNYGFMAGGVTATAGGILYNYAGGTITATAAALNDIDGPIAYNAGLLTGADGIVIQGGTVTNLGTIQAATYAVDFTAHIPENFLILGPTAVTDGKINLNGGVLDLLSAPYKTGTLATAPADLAGITLAAHANWIFNAPITTPTLTNNGTLFDRAGLAVTTTLAGAGTLILDSSLTLAAAASQKIVFGPTPETLTLTAPQNFAATIQNFTLSDTIDLSTIPLSSITGETLARNILTLTEATAALHFTFASLPTHDIFTLTQAGAGTALTLSARAASAVPLLPHPSTISSLPAITLQP